MSLDPRAQAFYRRALSEHESGPGALGFDLAESQTERFHLLQRQIVQAANDGELEYEFSLVDVGCGTGDLIRYLRQAMLEPTRYVGIDLMPEMIARASQLTQADPYVGRGGTVEFEAGDIQEWGYKDKFDVGCALATMCLKPDHEDQADSLYKVQQMVMDLATRCTSLVVVTCLSTWKTNVIGEEMVVDPAAMFSWARQRFPRVDLIHSYAPHDMALVIRLQQGRWWRAWRERTSS